MSEIDIKVQESKKANGTILLLVHSILEYFASEHLCNELLSWVIEISMIKLHSK